MDSQQIGPRKMHNTRKSERRKRGAEEVEFPKKSKMKNHHNIRESEGLKIYELYWESFTKGDLETFASTIDDLFEMIGTSESEVWHSKGDGIEFFKSQTNEIVGRTEMRNRIISAKPVNGMLLINETCDVYVLGELE
jgi:hypothetical protein